MNNVTNILNDIKELKAKLIEENGNDIILKLSTKDLLLYLIAKDSQQDKDIEKLKEKVNIVCAIVSGIAITIIATLFIRLI